MYIYKNRLKLVAYLTSTVVNKKLLQKASLIFHKGIAHNTTTNCYALILQLSGKLAKRSFKLNRSSVKNKKVYEAFFAILNLNKAEIKKIEVTITWWQKVQDLNMGAASCTFLYYVAECWLKSWENPLSVELWSLLGGGRKLGEQSNRTKNVNKILKSITQKFKSLQWRMRRVLWKQGEVKKPPTQ